ncbi:MAG: ankyrin repeat domain-containing protein [Clostridia bacterium]|nr:ankyrin repeat domain-containing protein [Clostridia bacterium]
MKKLFQAIRKKDNDTVKQLIEKQPKFVNCIAKQPPKKDDGQSPLQIAIKTGNFEIADFLIERGSDVNFIEPEGSYDDWRMPVLNYAILAAVMNCRHNSKFESGGKIFFQEFSSKEKADASFGILKRLLESGADVGKKESHGASCVWRLCKSAEDILPSYSWEEHRVSDSAEVTSQWRSDLSRIFAVLKEYGADFGSEDIKEFYFEINHPVRQFLISVK